jgi:Tfp pilus assembly protein PilF
MHAQGLTQLGVLSLRAKGSPEDAAVMFERALAVEPRFVRAWVNIGVIASRRRDLDGAVRATERAVELAPNHVGARINLARYYLGLRKPKAAGLHARRATVLAPKNASAWALASVAARLLGDPDAGALAAEARRIDPNNRDVRRLGTSR